MWTTFSEPEKFPFLFPSVMSSDEGLYSVYKHLLLAHANTYKMFKAYLPQLPSRKFFFDPIEYHFE